MHEIILKPFSSTEKGFFHIEKEKRYDEESVKKLIQHRGQAHGWRTSALACERHEGSTIREADYRHRKLIHPVRSGARAPARSGAACQNRDRKTGLFRSRIQHDCHRRRHRDGARRDALFASLARHHCRQRGVYGQRA